MTRTLFLSIFVIAFGALTFSQASVAEAPSVPGTTLINGASQGFSDLGWIGKPMSPLVRKTGYRCRRDCDGCRSDCYDRFRIYCYGPYCRDQFVQCMRYCWEEICRDC